MFKMFITAKRRAGVSLEEFREHLNVRHPKFAGSLIPHGSGTSVIHRRSVILRDDPFHKLISDGRTDPGSPFDCIVEVEWESREAAEASMKLMADPEIISKIEEDES